MPAGRWFGRSVLGLVMIVGPSPSLQSIYGIREDTEELLDAGYLTTADLATTDLDDVATIEGNSLNCARHLSMLLAQSWVTGPTTTKNSDCLFC